MDSFILELMKGAVKTHIAHLRTQSFAAHSALGEFYTALPDMADNLAEQWQGVTGTLIEFHSCQLDPINTVEGAIEYLKVLYTSASSLQKTCEYSEICNTLDEVKSLINTTKYKLIFLK